MVAKVEPQEDAPGLLQRARDMLLANGQQRAASLVQQALLELSQPRDEGLKPEQLNSANDD